MGRGDAGSVPGEDLGHEGHRLVAELERLLHYRAGDGARLHAGERLVLFVERDDRHLADLVGVADGIENRRPVVAPQADERGNIDLDDLRGKVDETTAGLMLTNPSTLGLFDENIAEIASIVHEAPDRVPELKAELKEAGWPIRI